jgi:hypothetical protein
MLFAQGAPMIDADLTDAVRQSAGHFVAPFRQVWGSIARLAPLVALR